MKKLFTTLALIAGLSVGAYAQYCYGTPSPNGITPGTSVTPGLTPSSDSLPCAVVGQTVNDTIYFTNFSSFGGQTVDSLRIDSLGNIPSGLCWNTSKGSNTFLGGEAGVIYVHGTCTAAPGQYTLGIFIQAWAGAIVTPPYTNAATLASLYYYTRVICPSATSCPALDTTNGKTTPYIAYGNGTCPVGINEVQNNLTNVSVVPNPFNTTATVTFNSDVEGGFMVKMMNLLGEVVATKSVNVTHGTNTVDIERNNLSSGVYILSISNGNGSISKKVIIE